MNIRRVLHMALAVLALVTTYVTQGIAQTGTSAALGGYVVDSSGSAIPDAPVRIVNFNTGLARITQTNANGSFDVPSLPIGTYDLTVSKQGFQTYVQTGIVLQVGQKASVNIMLKVGQVSETVNVNAHAQVLETQTSSVGQVVSDRYLADLPLNGRNPAALMSLVAGTTASNAPAVYSGIRAGSTANINGGRYNEVNYLFDGNNYSSGYFNTGLDYPNPDALQEFKLITHNFSAEYGRNAGAVLAAITKSGTNEFHGDAWDFVRNDALNATNFFTKTVPRLNQNQFGIAGGAPIKKGKLFAFGSYQGFRIKQVALETNSPVGTPAERNGDFSERLPTTIIRDPQTGQPFPGNIIPPDRLNPEATSWYNTYVPLPNNATGNGLTTSASSPVNISQYLAKVDYQINSNHRLSVRWFYDLPRVTLALSGGNTLPNYLVPTNTSKVQDVAVSETWIISPTLLNDVHVGLNHNHTRIGMTSDSSALKVFNSTMGLNLPDWDMAGNTKSPWINISGDIAQQGSTYDEYTMEPQVSDTLTWIHGKHSVKFGMQFAVDYYHDRASGDERFYFNGSFTGNGLSDFLLGRPSTFQMLTPYVVDMYAPRYYPFVQDDIKLTKRLTVNLGFRYELNHPYTLKRKGSKFPYQSAIWIPGRQSTVFPGAPPGLLYYGDPGVTKSMYPTYKGNFEPRIGFAWQPTGSGNWVIRGGYGIFSDVGIPDQPGQTYSNQPFRLAVTLPGPSGGFTDPFLGQPGGDPFIPGNSFGYPVPWVFDPDHVAPFVMPANVQTSDPNYRDPFIQQWNVGMQRSFGANWLFDLSYVAQAATHLNWSTQGNPAQYIPGVDANGNPLSTPGNVNSRRIYYPGQIGSVQHAASTGNANFNSLQFTVQKRWGSGLTFLSSYTWSHSIDFSSQPNIGGGIQLNCQNPFDCAAERGDSDFDIRHVYALSIVYEVPKFRTGTGFVDRLVNGWEVATIFTARTGSPFTITSGPNNSLTGDGKDRPNLVGDPLKVDRSSLEQAMAHWFNTAAFQINPIGTFGDLGRNTMRGPAYWGDDLSILKNIPVSEKFGRLELRAEFFNLTNRVQLGNPVSVVSSSQFGKITGGGGSRLIQLALKYLW